MTMPPAIIYDLHDSVIVAVSTGPRREVTFVVDLSPIFYPDKPRILLRFGGIVNYENVCAYVKAIATEAEHAYLGCRIDTFQYDLKKVSRAHGYWFLLETDWGGPLRIHCAKMAMNQRDNCDHNAAADTDTRRR